MIRRLAFVFCSTLLVCCAAAAQTTLNGAGATFPYPIYSKWFSEYHKQHPEIEINYQSIGSGGGIRQVVAGTVGFGATDGPIEAQQISGAQTTVYHVPPILGRRRPAWARRATKAWRA